MSYGRGEKIERNFDNPKSRKSRKEEKKHKHQRERRRAKEDPECLPEYRKYDGWEY
jgi:hypothetical protein